MIRRHMTDAQNRLRAKAVKAGLCRECLKSTPKPGKKTCDLCLLLAYERVQHARRMKARAKAKKETDP